MMLHSDGYRALARMLLAAAGDLCGGRLVMAHEGGYSPWLTPYCGLAVIEELSGVRTDIADPFLPLIAGFGGQDLQPHQAAVIDRAVELLPRIARPTVPA
jgi:hypothetical protein